MDKNGLFDKYFKNGLIKKDFKCRIVRKKVAADFRYHQPTWNEVKNFHLEKKFTKLDTIILKSKKFQSDDEQENKNFLNRTFSVSTSLHW